MSTPLTYFTRHLKADLKCAIKLIFATLYICTATI